MLQSETSGLKVLMEKLNQQKIVQNKQQDAVPTSSSFSIQASNSGALSKFFITSLVVWSMTKNNALGAEKQNRKSNGEQSDLCDFEQVALKPQLQVRRCLTTWLQIWHHSLLWGKVSERAPA